MDPEWRGDLVDVLLDFFKSELGEREEVSEGGPGGRFKRGGVSKEQREGAPEGCLWVWFSGPKFPLRLRRWFEGMVAQISLFIVWACVERPRLLQ